MWARWGGGCGRGTGATPRSSTVHTTPHIPCFAGGAAAALACLVACAALAGLASGQACKSAYQFISDRPELSQFKLALDRSNLATMLDDPTWTVRQ